MQGNLRYAPVQQQDDENEGLELQPVPPPQAPYWDPQYAAAATYNASLPQQPQQPQQLQQPQQPQEPQQPQPGLPSDVYRLPVNPYARPAHVFIPPPPTAEQFKQRINSRRVEFDSMRYLNDSWDMVKSNFCTFLGLMLMSILVIGAAVVLSFVTVMHFAHRPHSGSESSVVEGVLVVLVLAVVSIVTDLLIFQSLAGGFFIAIFNAMRSDGQIKFKDFFAGFRCRYFPRLVGFACLRFAFNMIAQFVFWPVSLYINFVTIFCIPMLVDQVNNVGVFESMKLSARIVHRYACHLIFFFLLAFFLQLAGVMCLGVGVLVTIPVAAVSFAFCYHHLIGVNGCPLEPAISVAPVAVVPAQAPQMLAPQPQPLVQQPPQPQAPMPPQQTQPAPQAQFQPHHQPQPVDASQPSTFVGYPYGAHAVYPQLQPQAQPQAHLQAQPQVQPQVQPSGHFYPVYAQPQHFAPYRAAAPGYPASYRP